MCRAIQLILPLYVLEKKVVVREQQRLILTYKINRHHASCHISLI